MPTAITHAVFALVAGKTCFSSTMPAKFWLAAVACSAIPDFDVIMFHYGVAYEDLWGHRGMTHSILFAVVLGVVVTCALFRSDVKLFSKRWWMLTMFFTLITASHGFLDAFTNGGLGIAFFSPFDQTRYFMPWQPLLVSHFGVKSLFTEYGLRVLWCEIRWVWLPMGTVGGGMMLMRWLRSIRH